MGFIQNLKEMLAPDTEGGVVYRCAECGATFETAAEECPECGSTAIEEDQGFDMRPDA
jgi:rubrerythrin